MSRLNPFHPWFFLTPGATTVTLPASSTDNAIIRWDGTGGATLQNSGITISDADIIAVPAGGDIDLSAGARLFGGGLQANHQTLAADTNLTLDENDSVVSVTLGSVSDNTINLPAASGNEGQIIHVYVTDGSGTNNAVVTRAGSDTISNGSADTGNTTVTLGDTADFVLLQCVNSSTWNIIVESGTTVG